ncbi:MAG: SRPBCC family protein [Nocardioides sp.]
MFRSRAKQPSTVNASATLPIARSPETVMSFLLDPVSAVMIGQFVHRSFHLPDTPTDAVGAQYVSLSWENGLLSAEVEELVDLEFPYRAVSVNRTTPGAITVAYTCAPRADGGTDYTQEVWIQAEGAYVDPLQEAFTRETLRCVSRIKEILEGDEWRPNDV